MCGICGAWNNKDKSRLNTMMDKIKHRGPDDQGIVVTSNGSYGHVRLSIMDPESGRQPIFNEDKSKAVIANGEIYNYPALNKNIKKNHNVLTGNDSEALVHLYEDHSHDCVNYLDGMFAFCITDQNSIYMARDYIGIKPLYYLESDTGCFYFSSEMKNLTDLNGEIREFPPGTWYHSDLGFKRFYSVPGPEKKNNMDESYYIERLRVELKRAITKRLMSDVPLGTFLSGGLDSSIISAVTAEYITPLHTFSVGTEGSRDLSAARIVSDHIGSVHHEYIITLKEVVEKLPEIIYFLESFDQDLVRSAIPCYFTSRLASDYVKVILTGEGADELFGGYTYYRDIETDKLSRELRRSVNSLHNINLQRVDRLTMAHSIEGRVPFLDKELIKLGLSIPSDYKLTGNPLIEKSILRKAFEDYLPYEIVWRKKEQFDEGSGITELVENKIAGIFSGRDAEEHRKKYSNIWLRSDEECYYHKIFTEVFPKHSNLIKNVARWQQR
jgi:asparagine synthase (glutamine-hydrolysing)